MESTEIDLCLASLDKVTKEPAESGGGGVNGGRNDHLLRLSDALNAILYRMSSVYQWHFGE
tara:strand:- start:453 stop:635 length:183 start_codon:yes stop_codon:yes gene_type:complete